MQLVSVSKRFQSLYRVEGATLSETPLHLYCNNVDVREAAASTGDPLAFALCCFPSSSIDTQCVMGVGDGVFVLQTHSPSPRAHTPLKYYLLGGPAGGKLSSADKLMECALQTKRTALIQLVVRM